eukprot:NODE_9735_length_1402_cov_8.098824.p1 GENE.NODE_9735_length_1402_cov_8.098824~~NODE_9735_length_1402_cov_8.098824.p1  ORF type:complete len:397 (+),score=60.86 NODE_9735_length_1402_cov_8.098824:150-1340(+)
MDATPTMDGVTGGTSVPEPVAPARRPPRSTVAAWIGGIGPASAARRALIVGQAPPLPPDKLPGGYLPFQGKPERRLARLAGYDSPRQLWAVCDRVDLIGWCPGPKDRKDHHAVSRGYRKHCCDGHRFPMRDAQLAASRLMSFGGLAQSYVLVVLCGLHVAQAFGLKVRSVPYADEVADVRFVVIPHPSGVSHYWNDDLSWLRAAGTFRAALKVAGLAAPTGNAPVKAPSCVPENHCRRRDTVDRLPEMRTYPDTANASPAASAAAAVGYAPGFDRWLNREDKQGSKVEASLPAPKHRRTMKKERGAVPGYIILTPLLRDAQPPSSAPEGACGECIESKVLAPGRRVPIVLSRFFSDAGCEPAPGVWDRTLAGGGEQGLPLLDGGAERSGVQCIVVT